MYKDVEPNCVASVLACYLHTLPPSTHTLSLSHAHTHKLQDTILRSFLPIVIGSTYKVQPGDTLARIAARLRTTVKKILEVNPDMHSPEIEPNQVCTLLLYRQRICHSCRVYVCFGNDWFLYIYIYIYVYISFSQLSILCF